MEVIVLFLLILLVALVVTLFVKSLSKLDKNIPHLTLSHFAEGISKKRMEERSRWKAILFVSYIVSFGLTYLAVLLAEWSALFSILVIALTVITVILGITWYLWRQCSSKMYPNPPRMSLLWGQGCNVKCKP